MLRCEDEAINALKTGRSGLVVGSKVSGHSHPSGKKGDIPNRICATARLSPNIFGKVKVSPKFLFIDGIRSTAAGPSYCSVLFLQANLMGFVGSPDPPSNKRTTQTHNKSTTTTTTTTLTMFLPGNLAEKDKEEKERKSAFQNIEAWSLEIIPDAIRGDASVSVQEVQCGDPQCAPIDTAVTIVFTRYVELRTHGTSSSHECRDDLTPPSPCTLCVVVPPSVAAMASLEFPWKPKRSQRKN